jgi:hypothetical protein
VGRGEDLPDRFFFFLFCFDLISKIALKALARRNFSSLSSISFVTPLVICVLVAKLTKIILKALVNHC